MGATSSKKVNPELADLVSAADTDKDGIITAKELGAMLQAKGFDWPRQRMEKLLGALDEDGDGSVTLAEFIKGAEQLLAVVGALHSMGVEQQLAAKAEEHHQAHLPPALAAWEPLGKTAAVKEAAAGLKELEAAFAKGPSGEAAEALHAKTEKIGAALKSVIDQRITEDKIVPRCDAAIQEGGEAFTAVYDAVSQSIEFTEAEGITALRAELSDQRLAERVGRGGAKAKQTKTGLMEVYAATARHRGHRARRRSVRRREGLAAAAEGDAAHAREGAAAAGRIEGALRHRVRLCARHAHRRVGGAARHARAGVSRRRGYHPNPNPGP